MRDERKAEEQLMDELEKSRKRIAELEASETELRKIKEAYIKSEAKYRSLIEKSGVGIATTDIKGEFTHVNKALCKMIGYSKKELIGKPFAHFLHPDDKKKIWDHFRSAWKNPRKELHLEFRVIHKKGHVVHCYSRPTIFIFKNKIAGFNAIITDITTNKIAEDALRKSEARYSELSNSITDVFFAMDKDLRYTYWNKASEQLTGIKAKEAIGKSIRETFPDNEQTRKAIKVYQEVLKKQQSHTFVNEYNLNGKDFTFEISAYRSKDGLSVFVKDITEKKKTDEELRLSEKKYRDLVENINEVIYAIDDNGVMTYISPAIEQIMGYRPSEIIGQPFTKFVGKEELPRTMENFQKPLSGQAISSEYRVSTKSGEPRWVQTSTRPIVVGNKVAGAQGVLMDITDRKQAEEQIKASLKEKEILLQEIHHRVKNNMQVISSILNLQSRNITDKQLLGIIKSSQDRVRSMALIHEKLYQSKNLTQVDFSRYVQSLASHLFTSYGIEPELVKLNVDIKKVHLDISTAIPCGLIISELVSNSLKHAFPGRKRGEIKIAMRDLSENEIELVVSDNGAGLPKGMDIRKTSSLGLRLVKLLAEDQLHGKIKLERKGGTRFYIKTKVKQ